VPTYYNSSLNQEEVEAIWQEAGETAEKFGYAP
jgi:hypothetical protein